MNKICVFPRFAKANLCDQRSFDAKWTRIERIRYHEDADENGFFNKIKSAFFRAFAKANLCDQRSFDAKWTRIERFFFNKIKSAFFRVFAKANLCDQRSIYTS